MDLIVEVSHLIYYVPAVRKSLKVPFRGIRGTLVSVHFFGLKVAPVRVIRGTVLSVGLYGICYLSICHRNEKIDIRQEQVSCSTLIFHIFI